MDKAYLSRREAAEFCTAQGLSVATATLAKYATLGGGPEYQTFGRFPRYTEAKLREWIESKLSGFKRSTSQEAARSALYNTLTPGLPPTVQ